MTFFLLLFVKERTYKRFELFYENEAKLVFRKMEDGFLFLIVVLCGPLL